jgi:PAS domain S-box-containing protein
MKNKFPEISFRELVDTINSGVAIYEVKNDGLFGRDYIILDFNKTALELEGKSKDEVVGRSLFDLRPSIDEFGLIPIFRKVWKTGKPEFFPAKVYVDEEFSNWYENRIFRVSNNRIVAIYDDVTDSKNAEEALRKSESLFREVLNSIEKAIAIYEPVDDGRDFMFVEMNRSGERITHYRIEDVIGKRIADLFPGESGIGLIEKLRETWKTGNTTQIPLKQYEDNRITQWVENTIFKLPSGNVVAMFEDTFEQRQAESVLLENKNRHELAERIGRVGNWEYNIKTGKFWGSDGARIIYGFDPSQKDFSTDQVEILIPERERVHQALVDLIEHETPYNLEFEIVPLDSISPKTITSIARLIRDDNGYPLKVSGIIQDITERKQTENSLKTSEGMYRKLFNSIRDAILVTDTSRNIIDCNQAFFDLFGYSPKEILNKKTSCLYKNKTGYLKMGQAIANHTNDASSFLITNHYKKKDSTSFSGEASTFYLRDDNGNIKGFVELIRDVSNQILLEEQIRQSQKMEAIGQLAGGVAHDFNNLLTIINGYSDILLEGKKQGETDYEELQQIRQAGSRAGALTEQLLAFSRKQVLEPEILDVNLLLDGTKKMLRRIIGEDIDLVTRFDATLAAIKADPGQLDQIILNLAVNARDAMPRGGKLTIETNNILTDETTIGNFSNLLPGNQVLITITDNGSGMSKKTMNRIFEPFFTTKKAGKGTGMGLPMAYGIVKQSGGEIQVFSKTTEPGRGTSFKIYFPAVKDTASVRKKNTGPEISLEGNETILIVEDEDPVRKLIEHALRQYGYELMTASGGSEALKLIKSVAQPIHLLLTDVIMPGMSGRELADSMLEIHPDIQICFMSGYTDDAINHHGILDQDVHFIQKPFLPSKLTGKIREILDSGKTRNKGH